MEYCELLQRLTPTMRRIALKVSRRSEILLGADDLYQEACMHLWGAFQEGKLADKTESYILQGCYFHLKNYQRSHTRRAVVCSLDREICSEQGSSFCFDVPHDGADCREQLHARMLVDELCNNGFTPREKEVLLLWRDALDTRQIGRTLGISHVRVVKLMANIRRKSLTHIDYA